MDLRKKALLNIRNAIKYMVYEQSEGLFKTAVRHLEDNYLSFLDGDRRSPKVLMGLWTVDQLSHFRLMTIILSNY